MHSQKCAIKGKSGAITAPFRATLIVAIAGTVMASCQPRTAFKSGKYRQKPAAQDAKIMEASSAGYATPAKGTLDLTAYALCGDQDVVQLARTFPQLDFASPDNLENQVEAVVSVFAVNIAGKNANDVFLPERKTMLAVGHATLPISKGTGTTGITATSGQQPNTVSRLTAPSGEELPTGDLISRAVANMRVAAASAWKKSGDYVVFATVQACLKKHVAENSQTKIARHEVSRFVAHDLPRTLIEDGAFDPALRQIYLSDPRISPKENGSIGLRSTLTATRPENYLQGSPAGGLLSILESGIAAWAGDSRQLDALKDSTRKISDALAGPVCKLAEIDARAGFERERLGVELNVACRIIEGEDGDFSQLVSGIGLDNKEGLRSILNRLHRAELYLQVLSALPAQEDISCLPEELLFERPAAGPMPVRFGVSANAPGTSSPNYINRLLSSVVLPLRTSASGPEVQVNDIKMIHPESNFAIGGINSYLDLLTGNLKSVFGMAVGKTGRATLTLAPMSLHTAFGITVQPGVVKDEDNSITFENGEKGTLKLQIRMQDQRCSGITGGRGYCMRTSGSTAI